jgi:hypothetical protein
MQKEKAMTAQMEATIQFGDPNDLTPGTAELTANGFRVEILEDLVDPCTETKWVRATISTDADEDGFWDMVDELVNPCGGEVLEVGFSDPPQKAA